MKKPIPFGKYYLLERINVGGMAEVFRAKAYGVEGFERLVAVKRILPNIAEDKEFIGMFIDEAKIAVQLNHANIAQIFDLGVVDGAYYIALEHIHGRDLRAIFDRCRGGGEPMPIAQACFVIMKTCEGLDYAHNKRDQGGRELGLVHRDVSPQNVLVSFEGEVKLIDFGIAKAAGKGSKTQAGILKGKFGYMSPEQVRGLPIDRRSDVFSCGIVLYELLTGERLFVGESDFSTLEKVRNVEILPPSTYNRKIPDELERIVLKALAKDVEDRYRNAIDLHDELQAFVYTAGEFYSRKDLAGWMKDTFVKEIEEESAKLEEFRQIAPPEVRPPQVRQRRPDPSAPPRSTLAMPAVGTKPPPIPTRSGRPSGNMPALPRPSQTQPPMAVSAAPPSQVDLDWDEEELETAIYDEPNPTGRPNTSSAQLAISTPGAQTVEQDSGQDLSSLVNSARSWNQAKEVSPLPAPIADGSNQTASALHDEEATVDAPTRAHPAGPAKESSAVAAIAALGQRDRQYRPTFGEGIIQQRRESNAGLFAAIAALALLLVGGGLAIFFLARDKGDDKSTSAVAAVAPTGDSATAGPAEAGEGAGAEPAVVDPDTGFDLIVDPAGVQVKLDGAEIGKAPLQIRNLKAGDHQVEIVAPSGFFNKTQTVRVTRGAADRVVIKLDAMEVVGNFKSKPAGAVVSLISDTERRVLGRAPVSAKLDPRQRYQVMFKKDRYTTVTKSVEFGDGTEVEVAVKLEKDRGDDRVASADPKKDRPDLLPDPKKDPKKDPVKDPKKDPVKDPKKDPVKDPKKDPVKKPAEGYGTLAVGSKPPCRIFIDGRDTGRRTPSRGIKLKAGKHRLTLVNNEFSIKKSYTVKIKAGEQTRAIKNLTKFIEGK